MSNVRFDWKGDKFASDLESKILDGVQEWAEAPVLTQALEECPVALDNGGTMRGSLRVIREDDAVYIGGGGPAKAYILKQHQDMTYNHRAGQKAKFILDPVNDNAPDLPDYIKKHTK